MGLQMALDEPEALKSPKAPFVPPALSQIGGPTYLTAQTIVQQVAHTLSDRIWTYSPDTFDLDTALRRWPRRAGGDPPGDAPAVETLQVRRGAASIALGYMFAPDFDLARRHVPQAVVGATGALPSLRGALEQLVLLYGVASPLVVHAAAVDYAGGSGGDPARLVPDYAAALAAAADLDLGLVAALSPHEAQHMALLATLLAKVAPTLHVYDGVTVGRERHRIIDVLDAPGLRRRYEAVAGAYDQGVRKTSGQDVRVERMLRAFNDELGTDYGLFEYHGHAEPDAILIAFGTVEASLAAQVADCLAREGTAVGVVNVRVYRPFVEEEFLRVIPKSAQTIGVLGQVRNQHAVEDAGVQSILFRDVFAALAFADGWTETPKVLDIKYPREQAWTPVRMASAFQFIAAKPVLSPGPAPAGSSLQLLDPGAVQQYTFWNLDDSPSATAALIFGEALSRDSASNVTISNKYDNLTGGGIQRTDIRKSKKSLDAGYAVESADAVYVGDEAVLKDVDVLGTVKPGGSFLVRLPGTKDDDLEKKLPVKVRMDVTSKGVRLYMLDTSALDAGADDQWESYLVQLAFVRIAIPNMESIAIQKLAAVNGTTTDALEELSNKLGDTALRQIEVPTSWAEPPADQELPKLPTDIQASSFVPFDKSEEEAPSYLTSWQSVAQGLAFKEALQTQDASRPDLGTRTWTIHLREHRRLTPVTYDRNIMHLEFDLGDSGMEYHIGDSLGIHPRNADADVRMFCDYYGLDPEAIFQVPARDDPSGAVRTSTVYHVLAEQLDIFGRPSRQFYEALAEHTTDDGDRKALLALGGPEGTVEFKRRAEVDTITYADVLEEFPSARPPFAELARLIPPLKRREYSIASCQRVAPRAIALMIVTVNWRDPRGRDRSGLATRFLDALRPGEPVTVSLKPSVMKLPADPRRPIILAGLGTGLAPFRAFAQQRAWERAHGVATGPVLLYMGSRHQREEYCYGEEWEAYRDAGVLGLLSCAFSRDQPHKVYIQDRMRETGRHIEQAYLCDEGSFYLCGPTWPVPDVQAVLEDVIAGKAKREGKKLSSRKEIERLKEESRYVLEVY